MKGKVQITLYFMELLISIGLDCISYLLLYMISLFDLDCQDETLSISEEDKHIIENAKKFVERFFHRYCKQHFGWKKGSSTKMEIAQILHEIENVTLIHTMESLM